MEFRGGTSSDMRVLLQLWGYARAIKHNEDRPIAIPLIEDAAAVAAAEAESVMGEDQS